MLEDLEDLEPGQCDFEPRFAQIFAFHDAPRCEPARRRAERRR
jgi:hypothetical protein